MGSSFLSTQAHIIPELALASGNYHQYWVSIRRYTANALFQLQETPDKLPPAHFTDTCQPCSVPSSTGHETTHKLLFACPLTTQHLGQEKKKHMGQTPPE